MNPPRITPEKLAENLVLAAEARRARSQLRARLASGEVTFAELLSDDSRAARHMPVSVALRSLPGIGKVRAERIMDACNISPNRRIRGLGRQQKERLLEYLSESGTRRS